MFVVKFNTLNELAQESFKPNKHGNYPLIGEVKAGVARTSLLDSDFAAQNNVEVGKLYACDNIRVKGTDNDGNDKMYDNIEVITEVSILDFVALRKELGQGRLALNEVEVKEEVQEQASVTEEV